MSKRLGILLMVMGLLGLVGGALKVSGAEQLGFVFASLVSYVSGLGLFYTDKQNEDWIKITDIIVVKSLIKYYNY